MYFGILFLSRPEKYLARDLISKREREREREKNRLEPDDVRRGLITDSGEYNVCPWTRRDTQKNDRGSQTLHSIML